MSEDAKGSRSDRTFTIEEVGEIVRRASEGKATSAPDHDRVTYDELTQIAAEVGVDEPALARVVAARETESTELAPAEAAALSVPAPALPSTLPRDGAIAAGVVAAAAGLDLVLGLGGLVLVPALLLAGATLVGRLGFRAFSSLVRAQDAPAGLDADHSYQVTFGDTLVDLTHLAPRDEPETVQVKVTFGEAVILLDPAVPYRLETSVLFGEVKRPREKKKKKSKALVPVTASSSETPRLVVRIKVLFGSAKVRLARD